MIKGPLDSVMDAIGETPLVRLDRLAAEEELPFKCSLYAKCEYFNAGGSVKDRIAKRMVLEAEKEGRLTKGVSVIIEPTSGNTGVGLALACAVLGYRCIICMPEKMSKEKATTIAALGAEIVRTPTEAPFDSPDSHIGVAKRLEKEIPGGIILDQYANKNNPLAHYETTALEIVEAIASTSKAARMNDLANGLPATYHGNRPSSGFVDMIVSGTGTGGTITGIGKRIREHNPAAIVLGVDPVGSILARPESLNTLEGDDSPIYKVEGIGYDFVPDVLEHGVITHWTKSRDDESFAMTRRLIKTEGLLCGGSSGTAVHAGMRFLRETEEGRKIAQTEGANVVFILPDSIRNYITKDWLLVDKE